MVENNISSLKKNEAENEQQYLYRIDNLIRSNMFSNWREVLPTVNKELYGDDDSLYKAESTYRKEVAAARKYYESGVFVSDSSSADLIKQLREERDRLYAAKRELADQRREYNKLVVQDGRANNLTDKLVECANAINLEFPIPFPNFIYDDRRKKEAVLVFSDWHYGMTTDNIWNSYNAAICKNRVMQVVQATKEYLQIFGIDKLHVVNLGDAFHGAIHLSCRIGAEEDTCDQLMHVAEIMAEALNELSGLVNDLYFYSCCGNHARTIQRKDDSVHSDNMEKIIPWWIKQRLADRKNIHVVDSEFDEFSVIKIFDYYIVAAHGDLDNVRDSATIINTLFNRKFGKSIDYILLGDKHHLEEYEKYDIETISVRSLCGTDDYANNKRLYSSAGQTLIIFNKHEGRECTRNIRL